MNRIAFWFTDGLRLPLIFAAGALLIISAGMALLRTHDAIDA